MRKVLFIFGQLRDTDVHWMAKHGQRKNLPAGSTLIHAGISVDTLYILLEGRLSVLQQNPDRELARLAAGEIVGEMSFIESRPPVATVRAASDVVVFCIAKQVLQKQLEFDEGFAARFYKAVAIFLSDRLRKATAGEAGTRADADELDDAVLDNVDRAGA